MQQINMNKYLLLLVITAVMYNFAQAQKVGKFGSSIEKKIGPKKVRVPYTDLVSYLGYAEPGSEDKVVEGKKYTYLYVWIPAVAPELGVRMVSPADGKKIKDAIKASNYDANSGTEEYFDTYITLEKSNITSLAGIGQDAIDNASWTILARNDDSGELGKQPSGKKYNSLLRYQSDTSSPLKSLSVGLYRVGFTTFKRGEVKGTFLAQIAAPIKLPGVIVTRDLNDLSSD